MPDPTLFRGYDRAALDREYDNQAKVPAWPALREQMAAQSAEVRAVPGAHVDVPYGTHPRQRLDVFVPGGAQGAPVHVFIHGGYWQRNDKAGSSYVARCLAPAGVVTVVVNYGLVPDVTMAEVAEHVRDAVAWVHGHAGEYGGDPTRITVSGHSAGGHLAAMLLVTDWAARGLPAGLVRAACGISGLYDLEPIRLCYLNDVLAMDWATANRLSPLALPAPASGSLLLAVGGTEGPEFHRQVHALAAAWSHAALDVQVLDLPGDDHFTMAAQLADPAASLSRALVALATGV